MEEGDAEGDLSKEDIMRTMAIGVIIVSVSILQGCASKDERGRAFTATRS